MTGRIFLALYIAAFAALLAFVFILNFNQRADFSYWPGRQLEQVPLVYLVLGGLVLGAVYASLVAFIEQARLGITLRSLRRRLARLEQAEASRAAAGIDSAAAPAKRLHPGREGPPPEHASDQEQSWNP